MKSLTLLLTLIILTGTVMNTQAQNSLREENRKKVNAFYEALENENFEVLLDIFAKNAVQISPYAPGDFPTRIEGRQAIYELYSSLPEKFSVMKFPRTIYTTEDPNFFFVIFEGHIKIKGGGEYNNQYISTFRFEDEKIVEYTEYFDPIVMAKAFGIDLNLDEESK